MDDAFVGRRGEGQADVLAVRREPLVRLWDYADIALPRRVEVRLICDKAVNAKLCLFN